MLSPHDEPSPNVLLDLRAEMGVIDHDFLETGCRKSFQMPNNERLAAGLKQGLGRVVG